jgi:hypothetical protein
MARVCALLSLHVVVAPRIGGGSRSLIFEGSGGGFCLAAFFFTLGLRLEDGWNS